jgi:uncharacterized protein
MTDWLWAAVLLQIAMGGFDTLYHHELTERLAWRPAQASELRLHGVRNCAYAAMFLALGWTELHGGWAVALAALLVGELVITLWDFVEEDRTRRLPASERVTHTLLTLNYGVILAMLAPLLAGWMARPSAVVAAEHGVYGWLCAVAAVGVVVSGLRDLAAARRAPLLHPTPAAGLAEALLGRRTILVTGGTGFVGSRLVAALVGAGHDIIVLTRHPAAAQALPVPLRIVTSLDQIAGDTRVHAIVNLAGEPISNAPWTSRQRRRILRSRLVVTRNVTRLIARLDRKPDVLVSGSAIGWYGLHGTEPLTEASAGRACFSRRLCVAWEAAALRATGVRVVRLRTGLVLDSTGGLLARLLTPFEFGLGGRFGDGRQWLSWIHRDDLCRLIVHAIASPMLSGPVNATAPTPVTNRDFVAALGHALRRPAILPVPATPLRMLLGDFADELLLGGQRVLPTAAILDGFGFRYPDIATALAAIAGHRGAAAGVAEYSQRRFDASPYSDDRSLVKLSNAVSRFARSLDAPVALPRRSGRELQNHRVDRQ